MRMNNKTSEENLELMLMHIQYSTLKNEIKKVLQKCWDDCNECRYFDISTEPECQACRITDVVSRFILDEKRNRERKSHE